MYVECNYYIIIINDYAYGIIILSEILDYDHFTSFSLTLTTFSPTARQVAHIKDNYHIYMLKTGRISMSGITTKNVDHVAAAIADAVKNIK